MTTEPDRIAFYRRCADADCATLTAERYCDEHLDRHANERRKPTRRGRGDGARRPRPFPNATPRHTSAKSPAAGWPELADGTP
jgi:hypothetical protein